MVNFKLVFPTYFNRYRFVQEALLKLSGAKNALNLGTGEGDYDPMIAQYCQQLQACDINAGDVAFARQLNAHVPNLTYAVQNALALDYADASFDLVVSVEVIEHVGEPEQMMREIYRVLQPGGKLIMTFPSLDFPFTYDPINRVLAGINGKHISQGAYAFGHEYLISPAAYREWAADLGFRIVEERPLSGYLVGLAEMYWTGWVQRIFKANSRNLPEGQDAPKKALRPGLEEPALSKITAAFTALDKGLFGRSPSTVGRGFILEKT